jgi:hypothetical protein
MKKLYLYPKCHYSKGAGNATFPPIYPTKRLPIMKLIVRIVALAVVFAGVAAATVSTSSARTLAASHQSATAGNPVPLCAPGLPTCPDLPPGK